MKKLIFLWAGLLLVVPCQAETICTEDIPGDVDENCKVDFNDFAIMASDWLEVSDFESNIAQEWCVDMEE